VRRLVAAGLALAFGVLASIGRADPARVAHAAEAQAAIAHAAAAAVAASDGVVNVNDANEEELSRLPGIGSTRARAILEHRKAHPFRKLDELTKIRGIGRKTFGRLRPYVTLSGRTTLMTSVKRKK
jgi:comEA protein